ncbi:hydrogenase maturation nickel metallochaperone HypA [bacterium]|nr:hydrogenase maturation nickel metallochaperone HypA [bacterium]
MHEMTIVTSILAIARERAAAAGATVITAVEVEVGRLAGVEIPALEFCFLAARGHEVGEQAELVIHEIPGLGRCPACAAESAMDFYAAVCPNCGKAALEVVQGRELKVRSIRVED